MWIEAAIPASAASMAGVGHLSYGTPCCPLLAPQPPRCWFYSATALIFHWSYRRLTLFINTFPPIKIQGFLMAFLYHQNPLFWPFSRSFVLHWRTISGNYGIPTWKWRIMVGIAVRIPKSYQCTRRHAGTAYRARRVRFFVCAASCTARARAQNRPWC